MPRPYGSLVIGAPTIFAYGSCATKPASTVSSPVTESTAPCWNSTMQSEMSSTGTAIDLRVVLQVVDVGRALGDAHPLAVQVRDARSPCESVRTRIFWPASKYCDENAICCPARAVDRHDVGDDVDRTVHQRRDALRVGEHLVLDAVRVAEDRLRDLADQVDVEAFEVAR